MPALIFAFPFAMNECQLSNTQAEIEACFARNAWGFRVYAASLPGFLVLSVILYARASRWALPSLALVSLGPLAVAMAFAAVRGG
ncbi:hypothetical protein NX02_03255 [Sphingomonas sanxanigenens DSM 19645 = NX02]|uniref:Uncharacterized protein n=1 Tax=Sphingomonas sanxanigenens DSM 19645 = NX02 TaxID=1123269 RepID=W0A9Q3_9SPHN|nr:hypothetical protein NX02_03255 [Sphingomonas sanxanigenens DSM 19645 = NX02]